MTFVANGYARIRLTQYTYWYIIITSKFLLVHKMTSPFALTVSYPYVIISGVSVITPELMKSVSAELKSMYHNSGKSDDIKGDDGAVKRVVIVPYETQLYDLSLIADKTSDHMQRLGINATDSIFSFRLKALVIPSKGSIVEVAKGAPVYSTHPDYSERRSIPLTRNQKVTVSSSNRGFYNDYHAEDGIGWHPAEIRWVGAGGYYKWIKQH